MDRGMDRRWGKARPDNRGTGAQCHLLMYHCLDVAAVGATYLRRSPGLRRWFKEALGIQDDEVLVSWFCFWLALHDLGKFSLSFQALRVDVMAELQGEAPRTAGLPHVRHDTLGMWFWTSAVQDRVLDETWFGPDEFVAEGLACWMRAVAGHHGQPPKAGPSQMSTHFRPQDENAAQAFVDAMRLMFLTPEITHIVCGQDAIAFAQASQRVSWWVAGVAVLADWIGSNARIFTYCDRATLSLASYWTQALNRADQALDAAGVLPVTTHARHDFKALFPNIATPSPLQHWASTVEIGAHPQLHLLEDVTGAGKTEAAMMLTHRLMAAGAADGFFIGLPTMATANAMYGRMASFYARLFEGVASLVLAHGRKDLVKTFALSVIEPGAEERDARQGDDTATSRCARWLADHNKRALLAPAGVGTVDQALLGVLQSKHQSLRLLGLFRKVLIVDEVHACDAYMLGVLETLLEFHASAGGSAILLSATLPERMKQSLLKAFARGLGQKAPRLGLPDYPLTTSWSLGSDAALEQPVATRDAVHRTVRVHHESDLSCVVARVMEALAAGQCVVWIRNTISDALQAHALLSAQIPADQITLFHARFTLGDRLAIEEQVLAQFGPASTPQDRRGQLLIATQVAEQSLDVDADLLVSDLAPIDRLIQRAGRLRRHARDLMGRRLPPGCPDERGEPWLWVYGPAWSEDPAADWFKQVLPKAAHVYEDHGQLWLSAQQLQSGAFTMPDDARRLIEAVYGGEGLLPASLEASSLRSDGKAHSDRSISKVNGVKLATGYERTGTDWLADTSAPSRLGDESVDVVLARWQGDCVVPWCEDQQDHRWAYSTVRVPRRLIDEVPPPASSARQQAIEQAKATMPGGGQWVTLLVLTEVAGRHEAQALTQARGLQPGKCMQWVYDSRLGLMADVAPDDSTSGATAPQR